MTKTLLEIYDNKLAAGTLHPDADQQQAIAGLEELRQFLVNDKDTSKPHRLVRKVLNKKNKHPHARGFYFYGGVGRGKSMIMDLFFASVDIQKKRRVHFHAFMLEVHDFLHTARTAAAQDRIDDTLIACADKIAHETRLLCFDEFQVRDVADAMILGRLFTALFDKGVTVIMTSNIAPDHLYADGLQRDRFLPFIALLKKELHVLFFSGATDYRLNRLREGQVYFHPHNAAADAKLADIFATLADGKEGTPLDISIKGRILHVPCMARETAMFSFAELCEQPKSALDYLELVKRFRVFLLKDVPKLTDADRNATIRFVNFIDTLYEHQARLVMSAAVPADQLYHGDENAKIFERTVSRLMEMQSREYRERP